MPSLMLESSSFLKFCKQSKVTWKLEAEPGQWDLALKSFGRLVVTLETKKIWRTIPNHQFIVVIAVLGSMIEEFTTFTKIERKTKNDGIFYNINHDGNVAK